MTHSALDARPARPAAVVTGGVDTHKDTHTAAVLDATGRLLGHRQFPTTPAGYGLLLAWLRSHGELDKVGIEGTGAYGAGLVLHLRMAGVELVGPRPAGSPRRGARRASPTRSTPRPPPAPPTLAGPPVSRKIVPVRSRRCARYGSPGRSAVAAPRPSADPDEVVDRHAPDPLRSQLRELLGLPAHPRRTAQARPSRRRIHNPPDPQQAADTSGTTASDPYVLATVPARAGLDLLPRRLRDHPETDLRLLRPGSRRPLRAHPGDDQTSAERGPPNWHATS
jgi:hypothetical protein